MYDNQALFNCLTLVDKNNANNVELGYILGFLWYNESTSKKFQSFKIVVVLSYRIAMVKVKLLNNG